MIDADRIVRRVLLVVAAVAVGMAASATVLLAARKRPLRLGDEPGGSPPTPWTAT